MSADLNAATLAWAAHHGIAAEPAPPSYLEEQRGLARGQGLLSRPRTTEEVSAILRACHADSVSVVPYGGGTGLVGGQVLPEGPQPLILSLERMNTVRRKEPLANLIVAEAGCTLAEVQHHAEAADRLFPLSLASEGSCRIGGNLATNAGGVQVLRYGNARDLCLGIEAVMADGSIHHGLTGLRKDNTGYDLRHLLIGSEGTLGVITAAALRLFPRPVHQATALAVVPDPAAALTVLDQLQQSTGGLLTAFELISGTGLDFLAATMPQVRRIFDPAPPWLVLAEAGAGAMSGIEEALSKGFAHALETGSATDVLIAQSASQRDEFWTLRESLPLANRQIGAICSHDISVPLNAIPEFITSGKRCVAAIDPGLRINCFGHLGDGNLHYNVFPPPEDQNSNWVSRADQISDAIYSLAHDMGGSISAEHGIGRFKRSALKRFADPAKLAAMKAIKSALDPRGILNPGAVL